MRVRRDPSTFVGGAVVQAFAVLGQVVSGAPARSRAGGERGAWRVLPIGLRGKMVREYAEDAIPGITDRTP